MIWRIRDSVATAVGWLVASTFILPELPFAQALAFGAVAGLLVGVIVGAVRSVIR